MSVRNGAVLLVLCGVFLSALPAYAVTGYNQILSDFERQYQLPSDCLAKIARAESNGNPNARNASTDAVGLFQWLPRSWEYATRALYGRVLGLEQRKNPTEAARITAFSLRQIKNVLGGLIAQAHVDECLGLYMSHFLGQGGASRFFQAYIQNPNANACTTFPKECRYNGSILNRTLTGVLQEMARKLGTTAPQLNIAGTFENALGILDSRTSGTLAMSDFMSAGYVPTGQDTSRTYPATFQPETQSPPTSSLITPSTPPFSVGGSIIGVAVPFAALLSIQPREVTRGDLGVVSWTSVGMSQNRPCRVSVVSNGKDVQVGQGNEGSRQIKIGTNSSRGTLTFTMRCSSLAGTSVERTAALVVK